MRSHSDFLRDIEESENGRFLVEERNGRALLSVFAPGARGKAVRSQDVFARLDLFKIEYADRPAIEEIVAQADGATHDVGAWRPPQSVDASVVVEVDKDAMRAWLELAPPRFGGRLPAADELRALLAESGVVAGIDESLLQRVASGAVFQQSADTSARRLPPVGPAAPLGEIFQSPERLRLEAARGSHPAPGRPAKVNYRFNPHPRAAPESSEGRVDFRQLNVIQTCHSGELLAELLPGEEGSAGFNVRGESLPPPASATPEIIAGANVTFDSALRTVTAGIDGHVRVEQPEGLCPRISVEPILELNDVDYSVGNIDYPGTVRIQGTVLDGFSVTASGDIAIEKTIGNVRLQAGGDISLAGGAFCRNAGMIHSGANVYARFVQDGNISANGSVYIEEAAINSRISAGKDIIVLGGRGEIIGGVLLAGARVRASKLGARSEALTQITVGVTPEEMARIQTLLAELSEAENTLRRAEGHLAQLNESLRRGRPAAKEEEATRDKLERIVAKYQSAVRNLEDQRKKLYAATTPAPEAEVSAEQAIFPGVEVDFGAGIRRYRLEGGGISGGGRFLLMDGRIILRRRDFGS
ncbi:MAG: FapA family protein [Leptospirales bacterium]|nr:FapA family protein [Leptospirales bacterium]